MGISRFAPLSKLNDRRRTRLNNSDADGVRRRVLTAQSSQPQPRPWRLEDKDDDDDDDESLVDFLAESDAFGSEVHVLHSFDLGTDAHSCSSAPTSELPTRSDAAPDGKSGGGTATALSEGREPSVDLDPSENDANPHAEVRSQGACCGSCLLS